MSSFQQTLAERHRGAQQHDAQGLDTGVARKRWSSRPEKVLARPTGFGHALATYEIPIEGRDEWVAAARRLA